MKFKKLGVISIIILWIVTLIISFFIGMTYHWASNTKIKTTKDYSQIIVDENDVADYKVFTAVPEKYSALEQIEYPIRKTISLYMQANNLRLSTGIHEFTRINRSLDDYINKEFRFEEITNKPEVVEVPVADVETIAKEQEDGITKEEAESLCREMLGEKAEENGFLYSAANDFNVSPS